MRKFFALFALVGVLFVAGCGSSGSSKAVSIDEFVPALTQPGVTIVDVRHPDEFAAGHVQGAINADIEGGDGVFDAAIAGLDKKGTYLVYCHSGRRAQIAADAMTGAGFTNVTNLTGGGIQDLSNAGVTIVAGP